MLCYVHQEVGLWGKARGIIANIKNLINPSILFVGKAFAENSSLTSLQACRAAIFSKKAFPATILDRKNRLLFEARLLTACFNNAPGH